MMDQYRQLAAIVITDIVGFTSLMGEDEAKAFDILKHNRELHKAGIQKYDGRHIKEIGDGNLCTFSTISNAVKFAVELQETCEKAPLITLKIGIHQAEVIFEREDVFGDGVNIVSRIEAITPAGCIFISEPIFRNIENKKDYATAFIGEKSFRNVKHPIKIYQLLLKQSGGVSSA